MVHFFRAWPTAPPSAPRRGAPRRRERIVDAARDADRRRRLPRARRSRRSPRRAGVATGTVYRHFPSKADLFAEVFRSRLPARGRRRPRRGRRRARSRRPDGSRPGSRRSPAARSPAAAAPRRCSPSRSTPPSRPSASSSAAPTPTHFAAILADGDRERRAARPGRRPRRPPRSSARSARRWSGRSRRPPRRRDPDVLVAELVTFCLRSVTDRRTPMPTLERPPPPPTRSATSRRRSPDLDLFAADAPLAEALEREGARLGASTASRAAGAVAGAATRMTWGRAGQRDRPCCRTHDRYGHRIDEVELDPAWHGLMRAGVERRDPRAAVARAAARRARRPRRAVSVLRSQAKAGVGCPSDDDLRRGPGAARAARARRRVGAAAHEPDLRPGAQARRREARRAVRHGDDREAGRLRRAREHDDRDPLDGGGRAPSTSSPATSGSARAPMCDVFLVLAQAAAGLSCFLLPRACPTATRKGSRSSGSRTSSATARYRRPRSSSRGACGALVGERGPRRGDDHRDGHPHAPGLRDRQRRRDARGVAEAIWHAAHRRAFGALPGRPAADGERARRPRDRVRGRDRDRAAPRARVRRGAATTRRRRSSASRPRSLKYWICKRVPGARRRGARVPRRQRLRRGVRHAAALPRRAARLDLGGLGQRACASTCCARWRASPRRCRRSWPSASRPRGADAGSTRTSRAARGARRPEATSSSAPAASVEGLALALQASLLVRHAPPAVADAFCAARLGGDGGRAYGTLPPGVDTGAIVARHTPPV